MRTLIAAGIAAVAVAAATFPPAASGSALRQPGTCMSTTAVEIAEGRLILTQTATGSAYILVIPVPTCLNGPTAADRVKRFSRIHLAPMNNAHQNALARFTNQHVHVRGHAVPAHTRYHAAPVVMSIAEIDAI